MSWRLGNRTPQVQSKAWLAPRRLLGYVKGKIVSLLECCRVWSLLFPEIFSPQELLLKLHTPLHFKDFLQALMVSYTV